MYRCIRTLSVVCAALAFAMTAAASAPDTSEVARAAFEAKDRGQFLMAIGLFNQAMKDEQLSKKRKRRPRPIRKDLEGRIATRWRHGLQIR